MIFYFIAVIKNVCKNKLKAKRRYTDEEIDKFQETAARMETAAAEYFTTLVKVTLLASLNSVE